MSNNDLSVDEQRWADRAGKALRDSEAQLDAVTVARLRAARANALERATAPSGWWAMPDMRVLGGAGAALAVAVLAWTVVPRPAPVATVNLAAADALELVTDEQGPEFYENLELYLWLEEAGGAGSSGA